MTLSHPNSDLTSALAARYGEAAPAFAQAEPESLPLLRHLLSHRSVRAYRPDPLPEGVLEQIVAAAQSAPTSSNLQAWSVIAVRDAARKARLAQWSRDQEHIREAPLFLVWLADLSRLDRVAQRLGRPSEANQYLEQFLVASLDAALAAQNAVLAAEALGLGTVYIGALRNRAPEVAAELQLPARVFPLFGLCLGYPDASRTPAAVKPRLPQALVLHHEHYAAPEEAERAAVQAYDVRLQDFQRAQGLPPVAWSDQASQRVAGPHSLSGRDHLRRFITWQGFELS